MVTNKHFTGGTWHHLAAPRLHATCNMADYVLGIGAQGREPSQWSKVVAWPSDGEMGRWGFWWEFLWISIDFNGISIDFHRFLWNFDGFLWNFKGRTPESQWKYVKMIGHADFRLISMGFSWCSVGERNSNDDGVVAMTTDVFIFMRWNQTTITGGLHFVGIERNGHVWSATNWLSWK